MTEEVSSFRVYLYRDFEDGSSIEYEVGCDHNATTGESSIAYILNAETDESCELTEEEQDHILDVLLPQEMRDQKEEAELQHALLRDELRRLDTR